MNKLGVAAFAAAFGLAGAAQAASQCFPATGTYGAVSVTVSGAGCLQNYGYTVASLVTLTSGQTCVLTFSKPLATSSFTIDFGGANTNEAFSVTTGSGPYNVQAADVSAPSAVYGEAASASASGGNVVSPGSGGGQFRFVSAPPASVTTLTITAIDQSSGVAYRVCADDAGAVVAAPVPTMSEWAMILLGTLLAGGAGIYIERRRQIV